MPAPAFAAYCEVSAETFALTMGCITAGSFVARCARSATWVHLAGLGSSLLTMLFSLYGLTYWFNGIVGHECNALVKVMGTCLSLSNALALVLLFIKARSFNAKSTRWERCQWLGLLLLAFHWGTMVASEILVVGYEVEDELDGIRCESSSNNRTFQLKWAAQTCHQVFQATVFIYPLRMQLMSAARARFKPSKRSSNWIIFRNPLWRGVSAVSCSLLVTLIIAAFAFAKSEGGVPLMPIFAVEVLHNAVNVATILFAIDVHQPKSLPKRTPRYPAPKLVLPARYRSRVYTGSGHGSHSFGYSNRIRGSGGPVSNGRDYATVRMNSSSRVGSHAKGVMMSLPPSRRYMPPVRRLPPVVDMSPESVTRVCSPSGDGDGNMARSRSASNALFFATHPPKKWVAASTLPRASIGSRRPSRSDSSGSSSAPMGTAPKRKVAPRRAWPPPSESSARMAERWGLRRTVSSSESMGSFSDYTSSATNSPQKEAHQGAGFQPEKIIHASRSRPDSRDLACNSGLVIKSIPLASAAMASKAIDVDATDSNLSDTSPSSSSSEGLPSKEKLTPGEDDALGLETRPGGLDEVNLGGPSTVVKSPVSQLAPVAD